MKSIYISPDKLKPEPYEEVLIKVKNPNDFEVKKYLYAVGYYADNDTWWTADGDPIDLDLVIGWINIPE